MVGVIQTKHKDMFKVIASLAALTCREDHVRDPTGMKKGCNPQLFGTKMDRQGALCSVALV